MRDQSTVRPILMVPDADKFVRPYRFLMIVAGFLTGVIATLIWLVSRRMNGASQPITTSPEPTLDSNVRS
jgi:hypothetical protein